eukprot:gene10702-12447_t
MDPYISINASTGEDDDCSPLIVDDSYLGDSVEPLIPADVAVKKERGHSLGEKAITQIGSFIFIVNQIYGPGVLSIPVVFQQAGWVMTLVSLTFFLFISAMASTLLCESLALIPGNRTFEKHIEYSVAIKYYFGKKAHFGFQILNNFCIQCYNIASIAICAQSMDQFLVFIFKKTFALSFQHGFMAFEDTQTLYNHGINISLGYVIICAIAIPMSFMNLDDNVKIVQTLSFIFLFVLIGEFIVQYCINGLVTSRVPAFGSNYGQLASVFIFSWAYPMFIPSWVNEKKDIVNVNKAVWYSGLFSWFGYLFIGLLGAFAYSLSSDNILNIMGSSGSSDVTRIASYLFSLGVILPGIPVCFITTRYNLYVGYICGRKMSYFWGVIAPWLISFVFCNTKIFANFLNWSSLIFNSLVNFIIPFILYIRATQKNGKSTHFRSSGIVATQGDSPIQPYPKIGNIAKHDRTITKILLAVTTGVCVTQIVYDLVMAARGVDILSS